MSYQGGNAFLNGFTGGYQLGTSMRDRYDERQRQKSLEDGIKKADEDYNAGMAALKTKSGGKSKPAEDPIPQAGTPTQATDAQQGAIPQHGALPQQGGVLQAGAAPQGGMPQQGASFAQQGGQLAQQGTAIPQAAPVDPYSDNKFFLNGESNEAWGLRNKRQDAYDRVHLEQLIKSGDPDAVFEFQKVMGQRQMERALEGVKRTNYNLQQRAYAGDPKALQELADFYVGSMPGLSRMVVQGDHVIPYDQNGKQLPPMALTRDVLNGALGKKMQADLLGISGDYNADLDTNKKRVDIAHVKQQIDESKAGEEYKRQLAWNTMARTGVLGTPVAGGAGGSGGSGSAEDKSSYFIDPNNIGVSKNAKFEEGSPTVRFPNGNEAGSFIGGEMLPPGATENSQRIIQGKLDTDYQGKGYKVSSYFDGKSQAEWVVTKDTPQGKLVTTLAALEAGAPDWQPMPRGAQQPQAAQQMRTAPQYTQRTNRMLDLAMGNAAQSSADYWGQYAINHYNPFPSFDRMMGLGGQPAYSGGGGQASARPTGQPPASTPPRNVQPAPATPRNVQPAPATPTKAEATPEQPKKAIDPAKKKAPPITDIERKQMQHDGDYDGSEYDDGLTDIERKQKEYEGEEQPLSDKVRAIAEATAKRRAEEKANEEPGKPKAIRTRRSKFREARHNRIHGKSTRSSGTVFKDDDELSADAEKKEKPKAIKTHRSRFMDNRAARIAKSGPDNSYKPGTIGKPSDVTKFGDEAEELLRYYTKKGLDATSKGVKAIAKEGLPSLFRNSSDEPSKKDSSGYPRTNHVDVSHMDPEAKQAYDIGYKKARDWAKDSHREQDFLYVQNKYGNLAAIEFGMNQGKLRFSDTPQGRAAEMELICNFAKVHGKEAELNSLLNGHKKNVSRKAINRDRGRNIHATHKAVQEWYEKASAEQTTRPWEFRDTINMSGAQKHGDQVKPYKQSAEDKKFLDDVYEEARTSRKEAIKKSNKKMMDNMYEEDHKTIKRSTKQENDDLLKSWFKDARTPANPYLKKPKQEERQPDFSEYRQSDVIESPESKKMTDKQRLDSWFEDARTPLKKFANKESEKMLKKWYNGDGGMKPATKLENQRMLNSWFKDARTPKGKAIKPRNK